MITKHLKPGETFMITLTTQDNNIGQINWFVGTMNDDPSDRGIVQDDGFKTVGIVDVKLNNKSQLEVISSLNYLGSQYLYISAVGRIYGGKRNSLWVQCDMIINIIVDGKYASLEIG